jgi:hypothetical protein
LLPASKRETRFIPVAKTALSRGKQGAQDEIAPPFRLLRLCRTRHLCGEVDFMGLAVETASPILRLLTKREVRNDAFYPFRDDAGRIGLTRPGAVFGASRALTPTKSFL